MKYRANGTSLCPHLSNLSVWSFVFAKYDELCSTHHDNDHIHREDGEGYSTITDVKFSFQIKAHFLWVFYCICSFIFLANRSQKLYIIKCDFNL